MVRSLRTQFVVADGSRARWVCRNRDADAFSTTAEIKASHHHRNQAPASTVAQSASGHPFNLERRSKGHGKDLGHFAQQVAEVLNAQSERGEFERLAVIAPPPFLSALRRHLTQTTAAKLIQALPKDLSKIPDHELGASLQPLELRCSILEPQA